MSFFTRFQIRAKSRFVSFSEGMDKSTGCFVQSVGEAEFILWVKTSFSISACTYKDAEKEGELLDVYQWIGDYLFVEYDVLLTKDGCSNGESIAEKDAKNVKSRCDRFLPYINAK